MNDDLFPEGRCPDCGCFGGCWIDGKHLCTVYDGPTCQMPGCDEPTVFVTIAAPGTGSGRECRAGHYFGTCRELELTDVT